MLYTDFIAAAVLAVGATLNAGSSVALGIEEEARASRRPARPTALLAACDVAALEQLSAALEGHAVSRGELSAPDHVIAERARAAAEHASGRTRETLLALADSARRSVLEFLVGYHLAAGAWEEGGVRMGSPALRSA